MSAAAGLPRAVAGLLLCSLLALLSYAAHGSDPVYLFERVAVVTMQDAKLLPDHDVLIEAGRIARIAPAGSIAAPARTIRIAGQGRYLMPGLAEMHAHVPGPDQREYAEDVLLLYVAHGVTTIRGMLGHPWHLELRDRIIRGQVLGPRLYTAGPSLNGNSVPGVAAAERLVREQYAAGFDFLKLHPGLEPATFDAIARTANELGIPFEGHVSEAVGLAHALDRRQRAIDHLDGYMQALARDDCARSRAAGFFGIGLTPCVDTARIPGLVARTREAGSWMVPTQTLLEQWALPPTEQELRARDSVRYLPPQVVDQWLEARGRFLGLQGLAPDDARRFIEIRRRLIRELDAAGVGVLLGSDAPQVFNVPGASAIDELELYVEAGLTPYRALTTGTSQPADFFAASEVFGRVAVGRSADLLLLAANPLEDVSAVRQLEGVMLRGRWLSQDDIAERLAALAARHTD